MGGISQIGSLAGTDRYRNENYEKERHIACTAAVMKDISTHPRHGKLIMIHGKCPTWAAENPIETWLPGIMKKVIHH